ncbi:MAG: hypothetical protein ACOYIS_03670 [Candidatus Cloacimonadaceae bacterium]|jgi:hypothetical protein
MTEGDILVRNSFRPAVKLASVPCGIETGRLWHKMHLKCSYAKACVSYMGKGNGVFFANEPRSRLACFIENANIICQTRLSEYYIKTVILFQWRLLGLNEVGYYLENCKSDGQQYILYT